MVCVKYTTLWWYCNIRYKTLDIKKYNSNNIDNNNNNNNNNNNKK